MAEPETLKNHPDAVFNAQTFLLDKFYLWLPFQKRRPHPYKKFTQLIGDPTGLANRIFGPEGLKDLLNLSSAQLSLLVPHIKLFKVVYEGAASARTRKEIPLLFNDFTEIDSIGGSILERGTDVGLQSFVWKDLGTNPAESGLTYQADLTIDFQTTEGIFKERPGTATGGGGPTPVTWRWADLTMPRTALTAQTARAKQVVHQDQDFQIKAVVGWSVPLDTGETLFKSAEAAAIERTQVPFLLTLYDHQIDLRENSTVTLSLSYIAAIEGYMISKDANLFWVDPGDDRDKQRLQWVNRHLVSAGQEQQQYQAGGIFDPSKATIYGTDVDLAAAAWAYNPTNVSTTIGREEYLNNLQMQVDRLKTEKNTLAFKTRSKAYSRLLEKLQKRSRIFSVKITPAIEQMWLNSLSRYTEIDDPEVRKKYQAKARVMNQTQIDLALAQAQVGQVKGTYMTNLSNLIEMCKGKTEKERNKIIKNTLESVFEVGEADGSVPQGTDKFIYFFFLGDLVEAALELLSEINDDRADRDLFKFLLGPVEIPRFEGAGFTAKERIYSVPMSDIPISLHLYEKWMIENVIQPLRESYDLKSFLIDIASSLIKGALSPISYGPVGSNVLNRISFDAFAWPGSDTSADPLAPNNPGRSNTTQISTIKPIAWSSAFRDISNLSQYFLLYMGGSFSNKLKGDPDADLAERGIIHFSAGKERGLIKSISFAKTDIPGAREARIEKGVTDNVTNLLFSNRYTATFSMFGNAIFKNGMYLYLNPQSLGIPTSYANSGGTLVTSLEEKLGLGGYYQVIKTSNIVEGGKFETNLALEHMGPKGGGYEIIVSKQTSFPVTMKLGPLGTRTGPGTELVRRQIDGPGIAALSSGM